MVDEEPPHERATSKSLFFLYVYLFGCCFFLYLIKLYGLRSSEKIDERRELECALQTW